MARFADRQKALELRLQGKSYSQIKAALNIPKSTLSNWLNNYPLPLERIRELRDWNEIRIEKYRETMRKKKNSRLEQYYHEQKQQILPFNDKEFYLAGLFLYWGEGSKTKTSTLSVSNTDPSIIIFFINWFTQSLNIPKEKLKIRLHLYQDMDIIKEINFWKTTLQLPISQFTKPYIKTSLFESINHKGGFGHGTCTVSIGSARIAEKILMALKVMSDQYFMDV